MKASGIVRKVSKPGVIIFPVELRRMLDISGSSVALFVDTVCRRHSTCICFPSTLLDAYERLSEVFSGLKELPGIDMAFYRDIYAENLWHLEVFGKTASKYNAARFIGEREGLFAGEGEGGGI